MKMRYRLGLEVVLGIACFLEVVTCAAQAATTVHMTAESLVLVGQAPGNLCFDQVVEGTIVLRSAYDANKAGVVVYEPNRDYVVDYAKGAIARTAESRIPDFKTNILYGKKEFDHNQFPSFGNGGHFVYVDYTTQNGTPLPSIVDQGRENNEAWVKFKSDKPVATAELTFTKQTGKWQDRLWETAPAAIDPQTSTAKGALPDGVTVYYFNLFDEKGLAVSSEHLEVTAN